MSLEWSHGKRRPAARAASGDVPALPLASEESAPMNDPTTGRFVPGNRAHRRRQVKERARGIATLNPKACPSWLSPYVAEGVALAAEYVTRFPPDPALRPLIGGAVDSWVVYRALLGLGAQGDGEALKESRAWLREHRSAIATLAALMNDAPKAAETPEQVKHRILGPTGDSE